MLDFEKIDAVIIGAGAAGLMTAIQAASYGKKICLLDHGKTAGAKILISGGGRCNFTNLDVQPNCYISKNAHFAKSALARYTAYDFMDLLQNHGVTWHEKTLGQLFCDQGAKKILSVLLKECEKNSVSVRLQSQVDSVCFKDGFYDVSVVSKSGKSYGLRSENLVIATGGLSIPKMGATDFAYRVAKQFKLSNIQPYPALVPFTFSGVDLEYLKPLAGVSQPCRVSCGKAAFKENLLFTHRGLSGPAILQISSYWSPSQPILIDLLPDVDNFEEKIKKIRKDRPKLKLSSFLTVYMADRLAQMIMSRVIGQAAVPNMADLSNKHIDDLVSALKRWSLTPSGTEGYKKAEVTAGGVDTAHLNQKTMEVKKQPGLYFVGECVDVTGWLGGYNFQWAWASGYSAGQDIAHKG